jgi:hypothetical protein
MPDELDSLIAEAMSEVGGTPNNQTGASRSMGDDIDQLIGEAFSEVGTQFDAGWRTDAYGKRFQTTDPEANGLSKVIESKDLEAEEERKYQAETAAFQQRRAQQDYAASPQGQAEEFRRRSEGMNPVLRTISTGMVEGFGSVMAPVSKALEAIDPTGIKSNLGANMERTNTAIESEMEKLDPSWLARTGRGIVRSGTQALMTAPLGTAGIIGMGGLTQGSQKYTEATDKGMDPLEALGAAFRSGGEEALVTALFSKFGKGGVEDILAGQPLKTAAPTAVNALKEFGKKVLVDEGREELIIAYTQMLDDRLSGLNKEKLTGEQVLSTTVDTLAQVAGMAGIAGVSNAMQTKAMTEPGVGNKTVIDFVSKDPELADKVANQPTMSRAEYEYITGIKKSSKGQREAFQQQVREARAGVTTNIEVGPEQANQTLAKDGVTNIVSKEEADATLDSDINIAQKNEIVPVPQEAPKKAEPKLLAEEPIVTKTDPIITPAPKDFDSMERSELNEVAKELGVKSPEVMSEAKLKEEVFDKNYLKTQYDLAKEEMLKSGYTEKDIKEIEAHMSRGFLPRDNVTGHYEARVGQGRIRAAKRAIEAKKKGIEAVYVEEDEANQGGLNAHVGHEKANQHIRAGADIRLKHLKKAVSEYEGRASLEPFRHGGDENSYVVLGVPKARVDQALSDAKVEVLEYAKANGLDQIEHPKYPDDLTKRGWGFNWYTEDIAGDDTPSKVFSRADLELEEKKKGGKNVNGIPTATPGSAAPQGQAGRVVQGDGQKVSGTTAQVPPKATTPEVDLTIPEYNSEPAPLSDMKAPELFKAAREMGLDVKKGLKKEVYIKAIEKAQSPGQPTITNETSNDSIDTPIEVKPPVKIMGSMIGGEVEPGTLHISSKPSNGLSAIGKWLKTNFSGDLPKEVFERNLRREGGMKAMATGVQDVVTRFGKTVREVSGGKDLTPQQALEITQVLKGDKELESLPTKLRPVVAEMRDLRSALSRELIRSGAVQGEMAETVANNADVYLNRSYRIFTEKNWANKVGQEEINLAISGIRAEMPDASEAEIQGQLKRYLDPNGDTPLHALAKGKLGSKDLSTLKHRKDLPVWLRRLWGEEQDPVRNYVNTVIKQSNLIENHKFLTDVKKMGMGKFLYDKPMSLPNGDFTVRLGAPDGKPYSPLAGKYTTKEIAAALEQNDGMDAGNHPVMQGYLKMVSMGKQAKTSLNFPMGHVRNFMGNVAFELANGRISPKGSRDASIAAFTNSSEGIALVQRLQKLGLLDGGVDAGNLAASIRDARNVDDHMADIMLPGMGAGKSVKKITNTAQKSYQAVDNWWKVKAFMVEEARYKKAHPEWTQQQLDTRVAEIVRDTTPSFSMLPEIIKKMRKVPLVGTFTSFPSEVIRTTGKTLALTAKELKDPATRSIGAKRLAGIMAVATLPAALNATSRYLSGVDKDDEDDLRRFMPKWIRNSTVLWTGKQENGSPSYVDLSFMDPYKYLRDPLNAVMAGKTDNISEMVKEATNPWLSENMTLTALLDVARNTKASNGRPVYNKMDTAQHITQDVIKRIWETIEPGTITQGKRIYKGLNGTVTESGRKYDPMQETLATGMGTRFQTVDIPQSLYFKGAAYSNDKTEATRIIQSKLANKGEVSPEEIMEAKAISESSRQQLFSELVEDIQAAQRLGVPRIEVREQLKNSGMSDDEVKSLMVGAYQEYVPRKIGQKKRMQEAQSNYKPSILGL